MTDEPTDADVISSSVTTPGNFGTIFARHHVAVYKYLDRRIGQAVTDDLVAETFVRAFEARERYALDRPNALPWLLGIATNLLRRHWREERRQLRAYARVGVDRIEEFTEGADARADASRAGRSIAAALASLSRNQRDVLLLHAYGELSDREIAEALKLPPGTVRSRLSRARTALREQIPASGQ